MVDVFPPAGHPGPTDPHHPDGGARRPLTPPARYYGDEVAVVVAEDEVAAAQALLAIKV